jgi:hypothetical protein
MDQDQIEQIKARVAKGDPYGADERAQALEDRAALVAEVERLRLALAGHLFDGESITAREAVRAEMINVGIRAFQSLDAVKELLEDAKAHKAQEGEEVQVRTRKGSWVDLPDVLQEILYAAGDETRPPSQ